MTVFHGSNKEIQAPVKISYGIYDTSQKINIGIIDLISLEYKNNKN